MSIQLAQVTRPNTFYAAVYYTSQAANEQGEVDQNRLNQSKTEAGCLLKKGNRIRLEQHEIRPRCIFSVYLSQAFISRMNICRACSVSL